MDFDGDVEKYAPYAVCAVKASGADWPHDNIASKASHLFGADDHGYSPDFA
jgi:hypothetical protein